MLDQLRDIMVAYLSQYQVCVLSTIGSGNVWAMPVRYRNSGLQIECLLPRWADITYHLEQDPRALLVIQATGAAGLCWLQYLGTARPVARPDWAVWSSERKPNIQPDDLYLVFQVSPRRLELYDESQGWGVCESLEL